MNIKTIQRQFEIERNQNEIDDINLFIDKNESHTELTEHIQNLKKKNVKLKDEGIIKNKSNNDLNSLFEKIDKQTQNREWKKLPKYIQNDKLRDFVISIDKSHDYNELFKTVLNLIKNGKIKCKNIQYDQELYKITSIDNLDTILDKN